MLLCLENTHMIFRLAFKYVGGQDIQFDIVDRLAWHGLERWSSRR